MMTGKQRAYLRSLANQADTILMIGKGGVDKDVIRQADDALTARELIKGKALEASSVAPREAAERIAGETGAEVVQVIGAKFVLYRRNPKKPKITLPKPSAKGSRPKE